MGDFSDLDGYVELLVELCFDQGNYFSAFSGLFKGELSIGLN